MPSAAEVRAYWFRAFRFGPLGIWLNFRVRGRGFYEPNEFCRFFKESADSRRS